MKQIPHITHEEIRRKKRNEYIEELVLSYGVVFVITAALVAGFFLLMNVLFLI